MVFQSGSEPLFQQHDILLDSLRIMLAFVDVYLCVNEQTSHQTQLWSATGLGIRSSDFLLAYAFSGGHYYLISLLYR